MEDNTIDNIEEPGTGTTKADIKPAEEYIESVAESEITAEDTEVIKKILKIYNFIKKEFLTKDAMVRLIATYIGIMVVFMTRTEGSFKELAFAANINSNNLVISVIFGFMFLSGVNRLLKRFANTDAWALIIASGCFALKIIWKCNNIYYSIGIMLILSIIICWLLSQGYFKGISKIGNKTSIGTVALLFILYSVSVGTLCVIKYRAFSTSCFDFGIFAQMFYYMKETFIPMTTCERNELLSHFAIHVSPIFYIILPIYWIFPNPETLLIMQAIIVISGIIPLFMLCKNFKLSNPVTVCICIAYAFNPALMSANFYEFHENKFLTVLILWFLYFLEKKRWLPMYIFMVLTFFVKEDAPIYIACIALFMIFGKKLYFRGTTVFLSSIIYFFIVTHLLVKYGQGTFIGRFGNYLLPGEESTINVLINIFKNPAFAFTEIFQEKKFIFMLLMLIPVGFLPIYIKKVSYIFLLIPFLLINLMPDYGYMYSIDYQYIYGVAAIFFYMVTMQISEIHASKRKYISAVIAICAITISFSYNTGKLFYYDMYNGNNHDRFIEASALLDTIPEDASVEACGWLVPSLSQRKEIYLATEPENIKWEPTDYIILMDSEYELNNKKYPDMLAKGYEYDGGITNYISIYKLKK